MINVFETGLLPIGKGRAYTVFALFNSAKLLSDSANFCYIWVIKPQKDAPAVVPHIVYDAYRVRALMHGPDVDDARKEQA